MNCRDIYDEAHARGMAALNAAKPTPMNVVQTDILTGKPLPGATVYHEPEGMCGFAWISIPNRRKTAKHEASPQANRDFTRWLKANNRGHKAYYGGWDIWVSEGNQSIERKEAYARAFSAYLNECGITSYPGSRLD